VLARAAAHTGYDGAGQQWSLVPTLLPIEPAVDAAAAVEFEPVVFQFAGDQLLLADGDRERGEPIVRTATETVDGPDLEDPAERLQVLGAVVPSRSLQVGGMVLLLLGAALAAVGLVRRRRDPLARSTQPLVTASGQVPRDAVETASLEELLELARRYDRPVLRVCSGTGTVYLVEEAGIWYRSPETGVAPGDDGDAPTVLVPRRTLPPVRPPAPRSGAAPTSFRSMASNEDSAGPLGDRGRPHRYLDTWN
jgi:hypothetical protein